MALEEFSTDSSSLATTSPVPVPEFGWQLWLLCSSLSIAVLSLLLLLAYYYLAVDDAVDPIKRRALALKYQQLQGQGTTVVVHFPKKEDKFERFKRWARCLRKAPAPANPPIQVCHVEVDVQVAIDALVAATTPMSPRAEPSRAPESGPHCSTLTPPTPGGARLPGGVTGGRCPAEVAAEEEGQEERLRRRILQFLIESGPPKSLCAISESEQEGRSPLPSPALQPLPSPAVVSSVPLGGSSAPMPSLGGGLAAPSRATVQHDSQHSQEHQRQQHDHQRQQQLQHQQQQLQIGPSPHLTPLLLDGEELLRVSMQSGSGGSSSISSIPLTRELLWAAFARLSAAPQQEALYHCVC